MRQVIRIRLLLKAVKKKRYKRRVNRQLNASSNSGGVEARNRNRANYSERKESITTNKRMKEICKGKCTRVC